MLGVRELFCPTTTDLQVEEIARRLNEIGVGQNLHLVDYLQSGNGDNRIEKHKKDTKEVFILFLLYFALLFTFSVKGEGECVILILWGRLSIFGLSSYLNSLPILF